MQNVTLEELREKVQSEVVRLADATSYRVTTSEMASEFFNTCSDVSLFADRAAVYNALKSFYPDADYERLKDVSKFLSVLYNNLWKWKNLPQDVLDHVEKMRSQLHTFRLVKV
jgi:hypothetical protein